MKILSVNRDAKTIKGLEYGFLTGIVYLRPSKVLCPGASKGCLAACLNTAGHGAMNCVQKARQAKTLFYLRDTKRFMEQLDQEIQALKERAYKNSMLPAVRINGTSDIDVQKVFKDILDKHKDVQFYDYTKVLSRMYLPWKSNYHLTFSRSEVTSLRTIKILVKLLRRNVAVVFDDVPDEWEGMRVVNGDLNDLRFLDGQGVIVGLKAKGKGRKDTSGFVVHMKGETK